MARVKDGGCAGRVGTEGHAVVVELRARVEFVDAWNERGFPDLETYLDWQEGELVELWGRASEGSDEGTAGLGSDLEGNGRCLFGGSFIDDICQVRLFRTGRATGCLVFGHFDGFEESDRLEERSQLWNSEAEDCLLSAPLTFLISTSTRVIATNLL